MNRKKEDKNKIANRGIAAGSVLTGIGGSTVLGVKAVEGGAKSRPKGKLTQEMIDKAAITLQERGAKDIKATGKIAATVGGSLLAASAIKKIKDNKKK